jgi:putative heme-binding domain-containing protein
VLQHSFSYALIESGANKAAKWVLKNWSNAAPAALIALDQMDNGGLDAKTVAPMLSSPDPDLKKAAMWVAGHHPDWGGEFAGFFQQRLEEPKLSEAEQQELTQQLVQFAGNDGIQIMLASVLEQNGSSLAAKQAVLQVMAGSSLKQAPPWWTTAVKTCLSDPGRPILTSAIAAAHTLSIGRTNAPDFSEPLLRIAREEKHPVDVRLEALAAIPGQKPLDSALFTLACANVDPSKPVPNRNAAVSVLARARLTQEQMLALTDTVKAAGPLEMTKLLGAFERSTNEAIGLKLVAALKEAKGLSSLRPDLLKTVLAKYPASVQQQSQELIASLNVDTAKQGAHIEELLPQLKDGDIRRGQLVFNGQKAACSSCHTMGYLGGKVGPDLTSIGQARTERDLLESIVYPSASFVRSYEPYVVSTKSDETYSGVLKKDAPDEIILAIGPNTEVRIPRSDIADIRPGTVSVMPAGLEQQLSKQELADLLAFLKSTKWGPR